MTSKKQKGGEATPVAEKSRKIVVNVLFDSGLLERIDADARRYGISRTAWLHVAASKALEGGSRA